MPEAQIKQREVILYTQEDYVELRISIAEAQVIKQVLGDVAGDVKEIERLHYMLRKVLITKPKTNHTIVGKLTLWHNKRGNSQENT